MPSQTTAIGIVVNRKTLFHHDKGGNPSMYDILAAAGTYMWQNSQTWG